MLHLAANWNLPVLASGGEGPLLRCVAEYGLGVAVAADSVEAVAEGLRRLSQDATLRAGSAAGWERFRREASWARNVDALLGAVAAVERERGIAGASATAF